MEEDHVPVDVTSQFSPLSSDGSGPRLPEAGATDASTSLLESGIQSALSSPFFSFCFFFFFSFFFLCLAPHDPPENLTCGQSLSIARRQCTNIRRWQDLLTYLRIHKQNAFLILITISMVFLLSFGLIFYYEPRSAPYQNMEPTIPVLHGYDLVAYFSLGKWSHATKGRPSLAYHWTDYNWTDPRDDYTYSYTFWFSSSLNREKFVANPWKYLPRFGGFSVYKTATEGFWRPYPDPSRKGAAAPLAHPGGCSLFSFLCLRYSCLHWQMRL